MKLDMMDPVPADLDAAVAILVARLAEGEKQLIASTRGEGLHFGLGTHVRNAWGLWLGERGAALRKYFADTYGLGHADDMSGLILGKLVATLRNEPFDAEAEAEKYRRHWLDMGRNPATQKPLAETPPQIDVPAIPS